MTGVLSKPVACFVDDDCLRNRFESMYMYVCFPG